LRVPATISRLRGRAGRWSLALSAAALTLAVASPAAAAPGVDPAAVDEKADPGSSVIVPKTVRTPEIPPNPDVVLLVDTTGSMGGAIDNVKANLQDVINDVRAAQPTAHFAVASYRDSGDGAELFRVRQNLTDDAAALQAAVNGLDADGGGDAPEAWINALFQVSDGAIAYRAGSSRIVVLVGDAPSHDPSVGHTQADAIAALQADSARVIAVNVSGGAGGLDAAGNQATAVVGATGGQLVGSDPDTVTTAILSGLKNLDVTVKPVVGPCDAGLAVTFDAASKTQPSGTDVPFTETIKVAADAPQGGVLKCTVDFQVNGMAGDAAFVQQITVRVNDVTAPVVTCQPTNNPAGGTVPPSSNKDGFYQISAKDNLDSSVQVLITDSADPSVTFGPYPSGTKIKLIQAPGASQNAKPGTGDIDYKVMLRGDAIITSKDAAGNVSDKVTCLVPPPPS